MRFRVCYLKLAESTRPILLNFGASSPEVTILTQGLRDKTYCFSDTVVFLIRILAIGCVMFGRWHHWHIRDGTKALVVTTRWRHEN